MTPLPPFRAPYTPPDEALAQSLLQAAKPAPDAAAGIERSVRALIGAIRARAGGLGGLVVTVNTSAAGGNAALLAQDD